MFLRISQNAVKVKGKLYESKIQLDPAGWSQPSLAARRIM